jgi:excisionase family DNA binding protein
MTERLLYPVNEAAAKLGVGRSKLYELISTGALESVKLGKSRLVPAEAIERFVADLRLTATPDPEGR